MRQIKVVLEKDFYHCPKREMDEMKEHEKQYIDSQKKGKRYNWTKRKPAYTHCEECGKELWIWDDYGQRRGVCNQTCYMHFVGMSWADFI